MDILDLLIGLIVLTIVMGFGIGTLIWAYVGSGSTSVVFPDVMPIPLSLKNSEANKTVVTNFQQATDAHQKGQYRQAIEKFRSCIQLASTLAEAYHNRGLAFANLRQDDEAVENLLKAGELYAQQNNSEGLTVIRQNLEVLKGRKASQNN